MPQKKANFGIGTLAAGNLPSVPSSLSAQLVDQRWPVLSGSDRAGACGEAAGGVAGCAIREIAVDRLSFVRCELMPKNTRNRAARMAAMVAALHTARSALVRMVAS